MAMVKNPFNGNLNSNEIFSAIYNMIISQQVAADNIKHNYNLIEKFRTDGGLYGDTKLFYATDVLESKPWTNDSEAANLLSLNRPDAPKCQAITIDNFRQVFVSVDNYLSKRAWATEGAFGDFTSVVLGWVRTTKEIYDNTLVNSYIGTLVTGATRNTIDVDLADTSGHPLYNLSGPEKMRMKGMLIGQAIADLYTDLKDYSRDFNDYKFLRSYAKGDLIVVWNAKYANEIRKVDLPTIFHKDGIVDIQDVLPERFFGTVITSSNIASYSDSTPAAGKPINSSTHAYTPGTKHANGKISSLVEKTVTVSGTEYHVFPGDEIPSGATVGSSQQFGLGETYFNLKDVICVVLHKNAIKFMSGFEVGTSFFNPRSLTENHYLTFGYGLDYLRNYPVIRVCED